MPEQEDVAGRTQLDRDVCKLVHRLAHSLDVHARRVAEEFDLTSSQVIALRELSEPITARELAARMYCEPSNATFVVDRLEGLGMVERRPHPQDRRAKEIVLTPRGERYRDTVVERLSDTSPLAPLPPQQQNALRDLLTTLAAEQRHDAS